MFEISNVYFIMPMPGSQEINSIGLAYFLYNWRWCFRIIFVALILFGLKSNFVGTKFTSKILAVFALVLVSGIFYATNFIMAADSMFLQVKNLSLKPREESKVELSRLVLGIENKGIAKAYPIQYLGYHHQVFDTIASKPVMVTYCTVCRTGRVFEPIVKGKVEKFRLVGMDHFNAMFEDVTTKSWWRQVSGEAIAGKLKGETLPEYKSVQMELRQWLLLYPNSLVMQGDELFEAEYKGTNNYENGNKTGKLTRRDTSSWNEKSWVIGIVLGKESKAYDWISLEKEKIIHDVLNKEPIVLVLSKDNKSFIAFKRNTPEQKFTLVNDTLFDQSNSYNFIGKNLDSKGSDLIKIDSYQEYWHSWQNFHPETKKF